MGSEIPQACFFLSQLQAHCEKSMAYEEDRKQANMYVEMIFNLLVHGSETQLTISLSHGDK